MDQSEFILKCREWISANPDWELICDIDDTEKYFVSWNELSKSERMHWIGLYGEYAKELFAEFSVRKPKVEIGVLDSAIELHPWTDWPNGHAMTVYRTKINGVSVVS